MRSSCCVAGHLTCTLGARAPAAVMPAVPQCVPPKATALACGKRLCSPGRRAAAQPARLGRAGPADGARAGRPGADPLLHEEGEPGAAGHDARHRHRQARARRGRVGTWYPTLLVYGTLPYWSCMHAALVGRWRRRRVSLGERCVGRPCQPDQYHTGMLPSQPAWLPLRRSPLVSSPKCCPCGSPPLREAAPAVCQTGRARAPVQVPPVLPHGHHPGGRHHHHPEGGRRGRAAQRLRAAAELPGARARV